MTQIHTGDPFPQFTFDTAYEESLDSRSILKGKTVFWVLRYIGCTVCRYDVHTIAQRYEEFTQKDAQVFVLMQSDAEHIRKDLESNDTKLPFSIICDPSQKIYKLLDIRAVDSGKELLADRGDDLKEKVGKANELGFFHGDYEGNEYQLPALFIVDEDGMVTYAHYAQNLMDMPVVDEVLNLL